MAKKQVYDMSDYRYWLRFTTLDIRAAALAGVITEEQGRIFVRKARFLILRDMTLIFSIAALFCLYVLGLNYVPSSSMEPTITAGSYIVCWKLPYTLGDPEPERGSVICFRSESDNSGFCLIKRVIGIGGDEVTITDTGMIYVNGIHVYEDYIKGATHAPKETYIVPIGHVFVLGDNREDSLDSRFMSDPFIPLSAIKSLYLFSI